MVFLGSIQRRGQLRDLTVADGVEVQQILDLVQREAKAFAAQDQLQAATAFGREQALLADPDRVQQLFVFIKVFCCYFCSLDNMNGGKSW